MISTRRWRGTRHITSLAAPVKTMLSPVAFPRRIQLRQPGVAHHTFLAQGEQSRANRDGWQAHFVYRIALAAVHHRAAQAFFQL